MRTTSKLLVPGVIETPVMLSFLLFLSVLLWERYATNYLHPLVDLMTWSPTRASKELTYYHRICNSTDLSTDDATELVVNYETMSARDAEDLMNRHGVTVFPQLISADTALKLRDFILTENPKRKGVSGLIENQNRWSFYLQVDDDPIVSKALHEILSQSNPLFKEAVERISGRNPAVIELTTITSAYGAQAQYWHPDITPEGNAAKYARSFMPSFSLFIPLQDTTEEMGATGVCPGTHMCASDTEELCTQVGYPISRAGGNDTVSYWPMGWGALLNQQTTHKGGAHTDPNGPHRVVFIITFAPRPRTGSLEVETRMIAKGGTYSLHWTQWGHTYADFARPEHFMKQPWRTLKSLGIYKSRGSDWGWDFLTQSVGRMANGEAGFSQEETDEFFRKGGLFFLPACLQPHVPPDTFTAFRAWIHFVEETTAKCYQFAKLAYALLIFPYAIFVAMRWRHDYHYVQKGFVAVLIWHVAIISIAWWSSGSLELRTWAHNIRQRRLFQLSTATGGGQRILHDLPASLPLLQDVLILHDMQSEYMASFNRVLEVVHPGNRAWNAILDHNARGYHNLTIVLQEKLRSFILQVSRAQQRRIMIKNMDGNWAEVPIHYANWFCHKQLLSRSDYLLGEIMKQIDYLLSETHYGYWRESVMQRKHTPVLLWKLQDAILRYSRTIHPSQKHISPSIAFRAVSFIPKRPAFHTGGSFRVLSFPPPSVESEPFRGAWLKEGDMVLAPYDDPPEDYLGRIKRADANRYTWTVLFAIGDIDPDMCSNCVTPLD